MTSTVRRAIAFAVVGMLAFTVPLAQGLDGVAIKIVVAAGPFLLVALLAVTVFSDGPLFELFARPGDHRHGTLYGLAGFSLAAAGLSILALDFDILGMPAHVYVATIMLLSVGNVGGHAVRSIRPDPALATAGFVAAAAVAGLLGALATRELLGIATALPVLAFLAVAGAMVAALLREMLFQQDDPLVLVAVALVLSLFEGLLVGNPLLDLSASRIAIALAVTAVLGYVSYALETASIPGMLTGVLLGLLTIVLGDYSWFAMLIAFFAIGGLASKFRYEEKVRRGIAEDNEGARGSGNVLANSTVALIAVIAAAASHELNLSRELFLYAFAGSLAGALADTLSSEIGGLYDRPRLITTLAVVEPGLDGAVTWQGTVAGIVGSGVVAGIGFVLTDLGLVAAVVVTAAGVLGMVVDSLLGATIEGERIGNQGVNFLATTFAGVLGTTMALALDLVG